MKKTVKEIKSYKDLTVWQKAMSLVENVYRVTNMFPEEERFGLTSQIRRCATSIPSNIAEGKSRGTKKDYRHFIIIAYGSASELETQLLIAEKLKFIDSLDFNKLNDELSEVLKMLGALRRSLSND